MLSLIDVINKISQFPKLMVVAIIFIIFPLSSLSEIGVGSCRFYATAGRGTHVSFICVAQYSPEHKALTCQKLQSCQIQGVKWTNASRNHVKFPAFDNWLSVRLRHFQFATGILISDRHKSIYELLNLVKLGSSNGLLPHATGHRAVCSRLQTTRHLTWFHWKCKI